MSVRVFKVVDIAGGLIGISNGLMTNVGLSKQVRALATHFFTLRDIIARYTRISNENTIDF